MLQRVLMALLVVLSVSSNLVLAAKEPSPKELSVNKTFVVGKHYQVLPQALPTSPDTPVMEFMYYGCRSCFQLAPAIAEWSARKNIGVSLVPAHSESAMVEEARIFHTFDVMGVLGEMYEEGFVMVQTDKTKLQGAERVNYFLEQHKVDKDKFWATWKSDQVNKRLVASAALTKQAQIMKTPTFIVNGIYKVDTESVKSVEELFELLEHLAAKKPASTPALLKKSP